MRILGLLPPHPYETVARALGEGDSLAAAGSGAAVVLAVRRRSADLLVVDPAIFTDGEYQQFLEALSHSPLPLLVLASLEPNTARRIVSVAALATVEVIVHGAEGGRALLVQKMKALWESSVPATVFRMAAPRFEHVPERLQAASVELFAGGPLPRWVPEFARASGLPRRTLDRWMERAGIAGASMLLDIARLARAWRPLVDLKRPAADVSAACGYVGPRSFVSHARRIVGVPPAQFGETLSRSEFAERLVRSLLE